MIDATEGQSGDSDAGYMPFRLWPAQRDVLARLQSDRRVIVLKARQLGLSWLCCGLALWTCLFRSGATVLVISKGQLEANEMLRRIKALYDRLPDWLRGMAPARVKDNVSLQAWDNGSRVESLPATQGAGRSFTGAVLILDEAAHMMFGQSVYASAKPSIDAAGGQLVALSTANGLGNFFHRLWTQAVAGLNGFTPIFLPWTARPDRDQAWYERVLAEAVDPGIHDQEYPDSPTVAFLSSGRTRFPASWIAQQAPNVRPALDRRDWPEALRAILYDDGLSVYAAPTFGRRYLIGADVAEGLETGDYSAAVVLDAETHEEMAGLHGRWEPDEFAGRLHGLAGAYAEHGAVESILIVERNNHGHAVLSKLRSLNDEDGPVVEIANGPDGRPGWVTSAKTKPEAIDALAVLLRDGRLVVRSQATLDEMQVYRRGQNGGTSAPPNMHDDRVMAWAVAVGWQEIAEIGPSVVASNPLSSYRGLVAGPGYRR